MELNTKNLQFNYWVWVTMGKVSYYLVLLSFVFLIGGPSNKMNRVDGFKLETINESLEFLNQLMDLANKITNLIKGSDDDFYFKEIVKSVNEISAKIDDLSYQMAESDQQILNAIYSLKNYVSLEIEMNEYQKIRNQIDIRYQRMEKMSKNMENYENRTLVDFASSNLRAGSDSVSYLLLSGFYTYFGNQKLSPRINFTGRYERRPLVDKIDQEFREEERQSLCSKISAQQYFYIDYIEMLLMEIKGNVLISFSVDILREHNYGAFNTEVDDFVEEQNARVKYMTDKIRKVIAQSSLEIRTCDPDQHYWGSTYNQLTRITTGIIVNKRSIHPKASCKGDCNNNVYQDTWYYGNCDKQDSLCRRQNIVGRIFDCTFVKNDDFHDIAFADTATRRYHYIKTNYGKKDLKQYGEISPRRSETRYKSWKSGTQSCTYCRCLLKDTSDYGQKYFSLDGVESDVYNNYVVVGVRLKEYGGTFYLQIQQAEINKFSQINPNTTYWKTIIPSSSVNKFRVESGYTDEISLDNVITSHPEYVVTGVRFETDRNLYRRLRLQARFTSYDFSTGKLNPYSSTWYKDGYYHNSYTYSGSDVPTKSPKKSLVLSGYDSFIRFDFSSWNSDAAQSTIPFFDTQSVNSGALSPLSGVGLYFKGYSGYGGFIAPKVSTFNYKDYV